MNEPRACAEMTGTKEGLAWELIRDSLRLKKRIRFEVASDSMAPLIEKGDWVLAEFVTEPMLRNGDIIIFSRAACLRVHRFLRRHRTDRGTVKLITKGDNRRQADQGMASPEDLFGRVVTIGKQGRTVRLNSAAMRISRVLICGLSRLQGYWEQKKQGPQNAVCFSPSASRPGQFPRELLVRFCGEGIKRAAGFFAFFSGTPSCNGSTAWAGRF